MHHEHPELVRDQYWDEVFPSELPYTLASEPFRDGPPLPSTANIAVKATESEQMLAPGAGSMKLHDAQDGTYDDAIHFTARPSHTRTNSVGSQSSMNTTAGNHWGKNKYGPIFVTYVLRYLLTICLLTKLDHGY